MSAWIVTCKICRQQVMQRQAPNKTVWWVHWENGAEAPRDHDAQPGKRVRQIMTKKKPPTEKLIGKWIRGGVLLMPEKKPPTEELIAKWMARSDLTRDQVLGVGIDCLDYIGGVLEDGGTLWQQNRHGQLIPMEIVIPGLTTEHP